MNTSPIESWEGAEAYFTFADKPAVMMLFLLLAVAITAGTINLQSGATFNGTNDLDGSVAFDGAYGGACRCCFVVGTSLAQNTVRR